MCCFKYGQTVKIRQRGRILSSFASRSKSFRRTSQIGLLTSSWDSEPGAANVLETKLLEAEVVLREKERGSIKCSRRKPSGRGKKISRQEAAERANAINLRSGLPAFLSGIAVIPAHSAKASCYRKRRPHYTIALKVKTHGVKALINDPMTRVIWVWDNTREEIPEGTGTGPGRTAHCP
jgi:hypothetical protein